MSAFQDGTNSNSHLQPTIYYVKVPSTPQDLLFCHSDWNSSVRTSDNINVIHDIILLAQYFKIIFSKI